MTDKTKETTDQKDVQVDKVAAQETKVAPKEDLKVPETKTDVKAEKSAEKTAPKEDLKAPEAKTHVKAEKPAAKPARPSTAKRPVTKQNQSNPGNQRFNNKKPNFNKDGNNKSNFNKRNDRFNKNKKSRFNKKFNPLMQEFSTNVLKTSRVTTVTKGGRRMSFNALVVAGNKKGKFGYGFGKAKEVPGAIKKASRSAMNNTITLEFDKNFSIKYPVIGKYKSSYVKLIPAKDGTGIVAGGPVRSSLELSGIKNIYSKSFYSRNPINLVKALYNAFEQLESLSKKVNLRHNLTHNKNEK